MPVPKPIKPTNTETNFDEFGQNDESRRSGHKATPRRKKNGDYANRGAQQGPSFMMKTAQSVGKRNGSKDHTEGRAWGSGLRGAHLDKEEAVKKAR